MGCKRLTFTEVKQAVQAAVEQATGNHPDKRFRFRDSTVRIQVGETVFTKVGVSIGIPVDTSVHQLARQIYKLL